MAKRKHVVRCVECRHPISGPIKHTAKGPVHPACMNKEQRHGDLQE